MDVEFKDGISVYWGKNKDFTPASIHTPSWFISINPNGWDDSDDNGNADLNECFEACNQDAIFCKVENVSFENVKKLLHQTALDNLDECKENDYGFAFCVWETKKDYLIVAGFDNGGCEMSMEIIPQILKPFITESFTEAHFNPKNINKATKKSFGI